MTEWLDIVDEHDCVIGKDTRARIHAEERFHRAAHILLFNSQGQVFVQLRSMSKDNNPGQWDTSAAGHVDSGESYLHCAVRELLEELGIVVQEQDLEPVGKLQPQRCNGFEFTHVFSVCSDQPLVLQAEEIDDGRWLEPAELDRWVSRSDDQFTDVFKMIWNLHKDGEPGKKIPPET